MATPMKWQEARDTLRRLREDQCRHSEEVVELWEECLADFSYKLADELWLIYEQVCVAACDCGHLDLAQSCIEALRGQFPGSLRVKRLQGLRMEAMERYDAATEIYQAILEQDETNSLIRKRLVAISKAQNKIPDAIKELNDYMKQFMSDQEGWQELCDLYLLEGDYYKAAYCMEEALMANPNNHLYHQKYAEIRYTQGGLENLETARTYFSQALKLNGGNMRALFGLLLAASNVAASPKASGKLKKDNMKYAAWAAEQISLKYSDVSVPEQSSQLKTVEAMLDSLHITHT